MTLPRGWRETEKRSNREGTWRYQIRSPKRFRPATLRTVPLEGVKGVKLIAGKLLEDERGTHGKDAMVPQAVLFSKRDWPDFREAIKWQGMHFTATENPPTTELHLRDRAARALDLTHAIGERGPKTFQARDRLAKWLDETSAHSVARPYRGALADIRHLESLVRVTANPPPERLEAFRVSALAAIARLATTETELQTLFVQALELIDRGAPVPEWIRTQARGLQLEKMARLEAVKRAVERHGAALGEFSVPRSRRGNPVRRVRTLSPLAKRKMQETEQRLAAELYREFHGAAPQSFHTEQIPDLRQLVHLGRALRVDYQAARQRGPRGTPYRHEFAQGSELFTDRTGRALVILGNLKVSRAPRGRFGYIRAGARA